MGSFEDENRALNSSIGVEMQEQHNFLERNTSKIVGHFCTDHLRHVASLVQA